MARFSDEARGSSNAEADHHREADRLLPLSIREQSSAELSRERGRPVGAALYQQGLFQVQAEVDKDRLDWPSGERYEGRGQKGGGS